MTATTGPWQRQREQIKAQLATNPRLVWGLAVIALLALLYANLVVQEWRGQLQQDLQALQFRQQDAEALLSQQGWQQRLEQARQQLTQQGQAFGRSQSEALARAELQAAVNELLARHNITRGKNEVSAAPGADAASGLIPLQLSISGSSDGNGLLALLADIEQRKPAFVITDLTVTQSPRKDSLVFTMLITTWFHPWGEQPDDQ